MRGFALGSKLGPAETTTTGVNVDATEGRDWGVIAFAAVSAAINISLMTGLPTNMETVRSASRPVRASSFTGS